MSSTDQTQEKRFVISLGGSLIFPAEEIDTNYLKRFCQLLRKKIKKNYIFYLVCGGGQICRHYQKALKQINPRLDSTDFDWMGIHTTKLNAQLLRLSLKEFAYPEVIDNYQRLPNLKNKFQVLVGAGWQPGRSSDYEAILLAKKYYVNQVINLSNVDYVYDQDPQKKPKALPLKKISWKHFFQIVGRKWHPGLNAPFDPIAGKEAQDNNLKVIVSQGKNLDNLKNIFEGKDYQGTLIHSTA